MDSLGDGGTIQSQGVHSGLSPEFRRIVTSEITNEPKPAVPRLSVVVVNYRQWDQTARLARRLCQGQLVRHGHAEVVIVDNHSGQHRRVQQLRRKDGISLRRYGFNHGFAKAVNEGIRLGRGEWVLLLNPDMTALPGFLDAALSAAERLAAEEPRVGIIGLGLLDPEGTAQRSTGPFPTLFNTIWRKILPRSMRKYHLRMPGRQSVPWTSGCCLMVHKACLEDIGRLDDDFFLYYEDVDLCLRAWKKGWQVWHEPAVCLTHHAPLHRRKVPAHLLTVTRHALMLYARKHWSPWQVGVLATIIKVEASVKRWLARDMVEKNSLDCQIAITTLISRGEIKVARKMLDNLLMSSPSPYLRDDARAA